MLMVKVVSAVLIFVVGIGLGILISGHALLAEIKRLEQDSKKYWNFFTLYDRWLELKQRGKSINNYLKIKGYDRVAIYGMGKIGERLYEELTLEGGKVLYVVDKNAMKLKLKIKCLLPKCELPDADVVIVTAICNYEEIKENIREKTKCPILSLEKVISDCISEDV